MKTANSQLSSHWQFSVKGYPFHCDGTCARMAFSSIAAPSDATVFGCHLCCCERPSHVGLSTGCLIIACPGTFRYSLS